MQVPDFWQRGNGGLASLLLAPLGWLYGAAGAVVWATARPWKAPVPVICIGNLVAGGAGKTPVALDMGNRLIARGRTVHFLSRGYGGSEPGPLRVDPSVHTSAAVGDEPLLLARVAPTWVAAERADGCRAAVLAGAQVIIMDDGFQNPAVAKDLALIVVDGGYGFGNGRIMPAGPLRQSVASGLKRAQAVMVIGEDSGLDLPPSHPPIFKGSLRISPHNPDLAGQPVIAFAGIGRPQKFFETLMQMGCDLRARLSFADHHPYSAADLDRLRHQADQLNARLVTTEKDAVRLPPGFAGIVAIHVAWQDEAAIEALLDKVLKP